MADINEVDWDALDLRLSRVFQPATPINNDELFHGRKDQVRQVVDAINQPGRHAILFGGRGVGKTSLAKTLRAKLKTAEPVPILSPFVSCDSSDCYATMWYKIFSEIDYLISINPLLKDTESESVLLQGDSDVIDEGVLADWSPYEVRKRIESISDLGLLYVVIDEFDKIESQEVRQLTADTIKLFSDHAVAATILVIGVSDNVTGLIDDHRSIERCLAQVPMPRMPRGELESIVTKGLETVGMSIKDNALAEISALAKGLPTYAHLLALHASRKAVEKHSRVVLIEHVKSAIRAAISQTEETIRTEYDKAVYSPRETLHATVLLACAMASTDQFGRFQPNDVCDPIKVITGKELKSDRFSKHLKEFCEPSRGPVLKKLGSEYKWRYQFANPLLQPYILMKGLDQGQITENQIKVDPDPDYPLFAKE